MPTRLLKTYEAYQIRQELVRFIAPISRDRLMLNSRHQSFHYFHLLPFGESWVHWQTNRIRVIAFGLRKIPRIKREPCVIGLTVDRDVVQVHSDPREPKTLEYLPVAGPDGVQSQSNHV